MLFSKQTPAAGGTAFAQFDAAWCYDGNGYILNDTGTSLDVRIGSSGSVQTLASGATLPIKLVFSMAELYVRRTDQSTTQVTVEAQVGTGSAGGGTSAEVGVIAAATAAASTANHNADAGAHWLSGDFLPANPNGAVYLHKYFGTFGSYHLLSPLGNDCYAECVFGLVSGTTGLIAQGVSRIFTAVANTACTKVGTWLASSDADYRGGSYGYTATAGSYIETTLTGSALGCWCYTTTNGGDALVEIDGDGTLADLLPVVTQDMVIAGRFAVGSLGKRFFSCYSNIVGKDRWVCFARSLPDSAHVVRLTATGGPGDGKTRLYVTSFGQSTAGTLPTAAGASPAAVEPLAWPVSIGIQSGVSEMLPVMFLASNNDFVGGIHGREADVDVAVYKNGTAKTLTAGQTIDGEDVEFRRTSAITVSAVLVVNRATRIFANGLTPGLFTVSDKWTFAAEDTVKNLYSIMAPSSITKDDGSLTGVSRYTGYENRTGVFPIVKDATPKGHARATRFDFFSPFARVSFAATDRQTPELPWGSTVFLDDRATWPKGYLSRTPRNQSVSVGIGDVIDHAYSFGYRLA